MTTKATLESTPIPEIRSSHPELQEVYTALVNKAEEAMKWYDARRAQKRRGARATRLIAIAMASIAALLPSVIAMFPEKLNWWFFTDFASVKLNPIATMSAVIGGTMVLLDKFYGFSSSWMRFSLTHQEIKANLDEFRMSWRKHMIRLESNHPPSLEQIIAVYDFLECFLKSVNESVRAETQGWLTDFRGALADIDRSVEAQRATSAALAIAPSKKGAINIVDVDYEKLDDRTWFYQLDNREPEVKVGQATASMTNLDPGLYRVRLSAKRDKKSVAVEMSIPVKPGEASEIKAPKLG